MKEPELLMIPGPTKVPPEVLRAMHVQMVNHRGPRFKQLFFEITDGLRRLFNTSGDVIVFPGSGTGAMEAAVVNFLSPGEKVLACVMGVFGQRFADIARAFGAAVEVLEVEWGSVITPEQVKERLFGPDGDSYKAVLLTYNETSTGVTLDLKGIAEVVRDHPAILIVDAVSAFGAIPLDMDGWGVDVAVVGSQKALMLPPGLAIVAFRPEARKALESAKTPRYFWDIRQYLKVADKGETPYTPVVSLWFGLKESLRLIFEEGLENVYTRHKTVGQMMRAGARALGLELLAVDESIASNTVSAIKVPNGVDGKQLTQTMLKEHSVVVAGGQGKLTGKIFRVGHLGWVYPSDILLVLAALEKSLASLGYEVNQGASLAAAHALS